METVLIVEDDREIAAMIASSLSRAGFRTVHHADAERAWTALQQGGIDIIILDLMLPGMDGLSLLRKIRKDDAYASIPVLIASAKDDDADIVAGLSLGADDYMVKPFSLKVLEARLRALLRRRELDRGRAEEDRSRLVMQDIVLDPERHEVSVDGNSIDLSATEFAILELLMRQPGRVFPRDRIIAGIRGGDYAVTDRSVDVHILSIRRKLGAKADCIETVRGIGYRFKDS